MREPTSPAEIESVLSAIWGKSGRQNGRQAEILSATQKIPKPLKGLGIRNAGDGGRTHTVSPPTDFELIVFFSAGRKCKLLLAFPYGFNRKSNL